MTDYRDPRNPMPGDPNYRDRNLAAANNSWAASTWVWIGGIALAVIVLVLVFAAGDDANRTAQDTASPPATTGQANPSAKTSPPAKTAPTPPAANPPAQNAPATPPAR